MVRERFHGAVRQDALQAQIRIRDQQVSGSVEFQAQRPAAGLGEHRQVTAVGVESYDAAILHRRIYQPAGPAGHVLGPFVVCKIHIPGGTQDVVGCKRAAQSRVARCFPGNRIDGYRPGQEVGDGQCDEKRQYGGIPTKRRHSAYRRLLSIIVRNSARVRASLRNAPSIWLVTMETPDL